MGIVDKFIEQYQEEKADTMTIVLFLELVPQIQREAYFGGWDDKGEYEELYSYDSTSVREKHFQLFLKRRRKK